MRNLLLLFILVVSTNLSIASDFYLRMFDHSTFSVLFNNSIYRENCRNFQMNNIVSGDYPIEVYNGCANSPCQIPVYRGTVNVSSGTVVMGCINTMNNLSIYSSPAVMLAGALDPKHSTYGAISYETLNLNDSTSFIRAKELIQEGSNDNLKLWFLKRCIFYHGISAERLSELMVLLPFDNGRLELAKAAYWYTNNREKYYKVYDSFIFSGTRKQLEDYLVYTITRGY